MKPYDVGLVCGRFQTFHKGHEKLVDTGLLLCDRLLILIGSAQESGTERNPFNINTRTKILREIYGDRPEIMIYALSDMTDENDVREAMAKDDRKKWMSLVNPRLHKMYDVLRAELMSVPFYQELSKN